MKNIAVMGAGNVGIYAAKAVLAAEDMHLCGFIRRREDAVAGFEHSSVQNADFTGINLQAPSYS